MRPRARPTRMLYLYCCAVIRAGETRAWNAKDYSNLPDGDRLLLWHGSRTTNFAGEHDDAQVCDGEIDGAFQGILKQGLRIAPPEGSYPYVVL